MRPFIYNFLEKKIQEDSNILDLIEYSTTFNLSVLKDSKHPAVMANRLSTHTSTKADGEESDSDHNDLKSMGTMTVTRANIEGSDSDNHHTNYALLGTQTLTLVDREGSDADASRALLDAISTRTLTESKETEDSDR